MCIEHRSLAAKKPMRRMLIKEYSLDSYTWQRKYAHLTSSITRAAVDEKLRRFSVSASMEEISKQANSNENMGSQVQARVPFPLKKNWKIFELMLACLHQTNSRMKQNNYLIQNFYNFYIIKKYMDLKMFHDTNYL